jgi:protein TonB
VTETGRSQWLIALALSLFAHLALGFWFDRIPPAAERITATGLTVSLAVEATGDAGGGKENDPASKKRPAAGRSKAASVVTRKAPQEAPSGQTPQSTKPKPPTEDPQPATLEPHEDPHPAGPKTKRTKRALQTPEKLTSAPESTRPPAADALASRTMPLATAPRTADTSRLSKGDGEVMGAGAGLRAATPAPGNPKPHYPSLARRRGYEGQVLIQVALRADGRAAQVEVKKSSGHRVLDEAALAAVREWRFLPAHRGGQPVTATVNVPISFRLDDDARRP